MKSKILRSLFFWWFVQALVAQILYSYVSTSVFLKNWFNFAGEHYDWLNILNRLLIGYFSPPSFLLNHFITLIFVAFSVYFFNKKMNTVEKAKNWTLRRRILMNILSLLLIFALVNFLSKIFLFSQVVLIYGLP